MARLSPPPRGICLFGLSGDPPTGTSGHVGIVQQLVEFLTATLPQVEELWILPVYRHAFVEKRDRLISFEHRLELCRLAFGHLTENSSTESGDKHNNNNNNGQIKMVVSEAEYESWKFHHEKEEERRRSKTTECHEGEDSLTVVGTAALLEYLQRETTSDTQFFFCLGADSFESLLDGKWRESERILELLQGRFIVVNRLVAAGAELDSKDSNNNDKDSSTTKKDASRHSLSDLVESVPAAVLLPPNPALGPVSSSQVRSLLQQGRGKELEGKPDLMLPPVLEYIRQRGLYSQ